MKKLVYILFCVFVPMLASCDRRVIYEDNLYSAIYDIGTNDWTYLEKATGEPYLAVTLTLKEITKQVCETGSVQCFRVYSDGTQACLPFQTYRKWTDETTGQEITFQDPSLNSYSRSSIVLQNLFQGLYKLGPDGETFIPACAESYEVSEDGISWTKALSYTTDGVTDGYEYIKLNTQGKFIRLVGHGNSANTWNSIMEFGVVDTRDW